MDMTLIEQLREGLIPEKLEELARKEAIPLPDICTGSLPVRRRPADCAPAGRHCR